MNPWAAAALLMTAMASVPSAADEVKVTAPGGMTMAVPSTIENGVRVTRPPPRFVPAPQQATAAPAMPAATVGATTGPQAAAVAGASGGRNALPFATPDADSGGFRPSANAADARTSARPMRELRFGTAGGAMTFSR